VITFFTIPKAWHGSNAARQRNAVASWRALGARVLLFGDEPGVAEAATELGADHVPTLERNGHGTPLLDGVFAEAHRLAPDGLICFANTDILFAADLLVAADAAATVAPRMLVVGESWDTDVHGDIDFRADWQRALAQGRKRGAGALDWFLFTHGIFETIPPFIVGRAAFDNWLVWRARDLGAAVVDATPVVHAIHQAHDYGHVSGGFDTTRRGAEAAANWKLIGSKARVYTRFDATHVLSRSGLRHNFGATFRAKERARKLIWKLRHGQLLPARTPR